MLRSTLLACLGLFWAHAAHAQLGTPPCAKTVTRLGTCVMGEHAVGFRRAWALDSSRSWPATGGAFSTGGRLRVRPVRLDLWYPAQVGTGRAMSLHDYVASPAPAGEPEEAQRLLTEYDEGSMRRYVRGDTTRLSRLWAAPVEARLQAKPGVGRFPIILYSAGWYNRSPDNVVLFEHLASRGYVVATVPQFNPALWSGDFTSNPAAVESQLRDLEFALGQTLRLPYVDPTRILVMGYSTGGLVALQLQGRNPWVRAAIALDPSFTDGGDGAGAAVALASPYVGLRHNLTPLLVLTKDTSRSGRRVIDSLRLAPRLFGVLPNANHGDFSDQPFLDQVLGGELTSGTTPAIAQRVLRTVIAVLPSLLASPRQATRDVAGILPLEYIAGSRIPSAAEWAALATRVGAEAAYDTLRALRGAQPGLTVADEGSINRAGYELLRRKQTRVAVDVFRFNTMAFPESANAYDSLIDGLLEVPNRAEAAIAARRLLALLEGASDLPERVKQQMRERAASLAREKL